MEKLIHILYHQQLLSCHFDQRPITSRQSLHESPWTRAGGRTGQWELKDGSEPPEHLCVSIAGAAVRLRTALGKRHPAPREWHWRARNVTPARRWRKGLSKHARSGGRTEQVGWAGWEGCSHQDAFKTNRKCSFQSFYNQQNVENVFSSISLLIDLILGWSDLKVSLFWFTSIFNVLPVLLKVHMCSWNQHRRGSVSRPWNQNAPQRRGQPSPVSRPTVRRLRLFCFITQDGALPGRPSDVDWSLVVQKNLFSLRNDEQDFCHLSFYFLEYYAGDWLDFVSNSWFIIFF